VPLPGCCPRWASGIAGHGPAGPARIPLPPLQVPRVLGIDDFALRRGLVYATVLIDAGTGRRVDVIPGRTMEAAGDWLREHPG
jgi:hypothetical protein